MSLPRPCVHCGSAFTISVEDRQFVRVECRQCGAIVQIEFHPHDAPHIAGRIETVRPPQPNAGFSDEWTH